MQYLSDEMVERPKRTLRQPIRFAEEHCVSSPKRCKKATTDSNLSEIEFGMARVIVNRWAYTWGGGGAGLYSWGTTYIRRFTAYNQVGYIYTIF